MREATTEDKVWWGEYNRPFTPEKFNALLTRMQAYLQGRDVFVQDCYAGADPDYRLPDPHHHREGLAQPVRAQHVPEADAALDALPQARAGVHGHLRARRSRPRRSSTARARETFIIANFAERLAIIGGSSYGGEIKKTIFTVLNFLLPLDGVLSMHCSANVGTDGDVGAVLRPVGHRQDDALGRPDAPADRRRRARLERQRRLQLRGRLLRQGDPPVARRRAADLRLHAALRHDPRERDARPAHAAARPERRRRSPRTRAAPTRSTSSTTPCRRRWRGHPKNIIFLTCDAIGRDAADRAADARTRRMYHFISGYTSKIAGTEIGLGIEPEITFSTCFGAPFMVHHPLRVRRDAASAKMLKHGATCWLVNTGWTGGPFGVGKRISIRHTRALLECGARAASCTTCSSARTRSSASRCRSTCEGVPADILDPANTWPSRDEYDTKYDALAARFIENFKLFAEGCPKEVIAAGPKRVR